MAANQLEHVSVVHSVPRQTPGVGFADVMGNALASAVTVGMSALEAAAPHPLLSAAVSGIRAVAQSATRVGDTGPQSMIDAQRQLMAEGAQLNQAYLALQQRMQQESQQYMALSNVMKVRHDSATAAIHNLR